MKNSRRFYNYIYWLYPVIEPFFRKQKLQLANIINKLPAGDLLEIGVGNGNMLPLYQKHIISGIDISERMLSVAKNRETQVRVHLFMADGTDMKFQNESFDYVVINHVLSVTHQPNLLLREAFRVLKPGGKLFIANHFTPDNNLKYIDKFFQPVAELLRFRSYFPVTLLKSWNQLEPELQISSKPFGYYKILLFKK